VYEIVTEKIEEQHGLPHAGQGFWTILSQISGILHVGFAAMLSEKLEGWLTILSK